MDSSLQEKLTIAFATKMLGIRNYAHEKNEFFVSDFLTLDELDYFLCEVVTGESDITPAGIVFLEKYYGFAELARILFEKKGMFYGEGYFKSEDEMTEWLIDVVPMEVVTFIETARGNIGEGATLRDELLPPKNV